MYFTDYHYVQKGEIGINRFFTDSEVSDGKIILSDDNVHHIKNVLRLNTGEDVVVIKNKKELLCTIDKIEKNSIILNVKEEKSEKREKDYRLTLIQGFPKGDKSGFIAEKAVEAGADEIIFVNMKRSVAKIGSDKSDKKLERFQKISKGAACQSGRLIIPEVKLLNALKDIDFNKYSLKLLCYEDEKQTVLKEVLKNAQSHESVAVLIGPEGGIDKEEAEFFKEKGFVCVSLGTRILRCETAGLYAMACINYEFEK